MDIDHLGEYAPLDGIDAVNLPCTDLA